MPKKFASWFAPACFAFLLFAAAGSASAQACDPNTDPNQCVVGSSDPDPGNGPHAIMGGALNGSPSSPGVPGDGLSAVLNGEQQPADDYYMFLSMLWGLS
ncbi:MAG TPA: hypothetical protein VGN16_04220 [Acidobacteriaceae bacterium]|jgi:hypothetical protein